MLRTDGEEDNYDEGAMDDIGDNLDEAHDDGIDQVDPPRGNSMQPIEVSVKQPDSTKQTNPGLGGSPVLKQDAGKQINLNMGTPGQSKQDTGRQADNTGRSGGPKVGQTEF